MAITASFSRALAVLFLAPAAVLAQGGSYSFDAEISVALRSAHSCIGRCLVMTYYPRDDLRSAIGCAAPIQNQCFCATDVGAASTVTSWIRTCASSQCSSRDIDLDTTTMFSLYASYCMNLGYTQPGATAWYDPNAPSTTTVPVAGGRPTTARVTTVYTTVETTDGGSTVTRAITSVIPGVGDTSDGGGGGNPATAQQSSDNLTGVALGVGLGLGIPLILLLAALVIVLMWRRKRSPGVAPSAAPDASGMQQYRQPEIDGRAVSTFHAPSPSAPPNYSSYPYPNPHQPTYGMAPPPEERPVSPIDPTPTPPPAVLPPGDHAAAVARAHSASYEPMVSPIGPHEMSSTPFQSPMAGRAELNAKPPHY